MKRKEPIEDHLLFRMMKFGIEHEGGYFTKEKMKAHLGDAWDQPYFETISGFRDHKMPNLVFYRFRTTAEGKMKPIPGGSGSLYNSQDDHYMITPDAASRYLEMVELREARKSANQAKLHSKVAIGVALILGFLQLVLN